MLSEEYLQLLEDNLDNIQSLVYKYHPYYNNFHDHKITAPAAEYGCELAREKIRKENKEPNIIDALDRKDIYAIYRICSATWFGMPESMESRYEPGFNVLCDLCSEYEGDYDED